MICTKAPLVSCAFPLWIFGGACPGSLVFTTGRYACHDSRVSKCSKNGNWLQFTEKRSLSSCSTSCCNWSTYNAASCSAVGRTGPVLLHRDIHTVASQIRIVDMCAIHCHNLPIHHVPDFDDLTSAQLWGRLLFVVPFCICQGWAIVWLLQSPLWAKFVHTNNKHRSQMKRNTWDKMLRPQHL